MLVRALCTRVAMVPPFRGGLLLSWPLNKVRTSWAHSTLGLCLQQGYGSSPSSYLVAVYMPASASASCLNVHCDLLHSSQPDVREPSLSQRCIPEVT